MGESGDFPGSMCRERSRRIGLQTPDSEDSGFPSALPKERSGDFGKNIIHRRSCFVNKGGNKISRMIELKRKISRLCLRLLGFPFGYAWEVPFK